MNKSSLNFILNAVLSIYEREVVIKGIVKKTLEEVRASDETDGDFLSDVVHRGYNADHAVNSVYETIISEVTDNEV